MNPSECIDGLIAKRTDWRGKTLASIRKSFLEADPPAGTRAKVRKTKKN